MADKRKLQGEMDRCFKKISEGVEAFDDTFKKMHHATNNNQTEKYEGDLKKEIKKLQRLREQIKSWASSSDVKDKKLLLDYRKLIETRMEKFKAVERETKTKAYSREGLVLATKIDPVQKAKDDTMQWLQVTIDNINRQVERFEGEIESYNSASRRRKVGREKQDRIEILRNILSKHRFHIKRLEMLMRMLDNQTILPDKINVIRDDIEYYLESCLEPDFEDNDFIYEDMGLDEALANNIVAAPSSPGERQLNSRLNSQSKEDDEDKAADSIPSTQATNTANAKEESSRNRKKSDELVSPQKSVATNHYKLQSVSRSTVFPPPPSTLTATKPSLKPLFTPQSQPYAAAAAGFTSVTQNQVAQPQCVSSEVESTTEALATIKPLTQVEPSPWLVSNHANLPDVNSSESDKEVTDIATSVESISLFLNGDASTTTLAPSSSASSTTFSTVDDATVERSTPLSSINSNEDSTPPSNVQNNDMSLINNLNFLKNSAETALSNAGVGDQVTFPRPNDPLSTVSADQFPSLAQQKQENNKSVLTTSGEAMIQPFLGVAPLGPKPLNKEQLYQQAILESSWRHMPHPSDSERLRHYLPRNMCPAPAYYIQTPVSDHDTLDFYLRLSTETLFFIFYYMEATKAQFMAAKALKKQSWRFHTKYMMWFQRHEEPKAITDEFEQGTYVYFDYEKWGQRKKEGFTFEYRYLEDRDLQ